MGSRLGFILYFFLSKLCLLAPMGEWCVTEFPFYLSQDVSEKNIRIIKHHVPIKRRNDAESVDNESTLSTTSNLEPFANDDLGKKKKTQ